METNFKKENFTYFGGFLTYSDENVKDMFISRFRYRGGGKPAFQAFLIKNFTIEEYQALYSTKLAPLEILQTKGYISPNIRKVLKHYHLPATVEGMKALNEINRKEAQPSAKI